MPGVEAGKYGLEEQVRGYVLSPGHRLMVPQGTAFLQFDDQLQG